MENSSKILFFYKLFEQQLKVFLFHKKKIPKTEPEQVWN